MVLLIVTGYFDGGSSLDFVLNMLTSMTSIIDLLFITFYVLNPSRNTRCLNIHTNVFHVMNNN